MQSFINDVMFCCYACAGGIEEEGKESTEEQTKNLNQTAMERRRNACRPFNRWREFERIHNGAKTGPLRQKQIWGLFVDHFSSLK